MEFIADILLGFGAISAAFYCFILSRKINRLKGLDQDLGGAIAVLSKQVDEMTQVLTTAQSSATESADDLAAKTASAAAVTERLELMIAALQGLPDEDVEINTPEADATLFVRNPSRRAVQ